MSQQAALLHAIWGPRPVGDSPGLRALPGVPVAEGLRVYRENAKALAVRALGAAYPRVLAWLGSEDFAGLAWNFARAHPPTCGDAAAWGEPLAEHLAAMPGLPALGADLARLDWALHRLGTLQDPEPADAGLWQVLQAEPPEHVRLQLSPGLACWHLPTLEDESSWLQAQEGGAALAGLPSPHVVVWRAGWQPCWTTTSADGAAWLAAVLSGASLADALETVLAQHPRFDLGAWLAEAWQRQWLLGARSL